MFNGGRGQLLVRKRFLSFIIRAVLWLWQTSQTFLKMCAHRFDSFCLFVCLFVCLFLWPLAVHCGSSPSALEECTNVHPRPLLSCVFVCLFFEKLEISNGILSLSERYCD